MKVTQIVSESSKKPVSEAPVSGLKQGLKKFGAKALAKVGAKNTAQGMAGQIDTGDEANALRAEFQNHVGSIGGNMKAIDPTELKNWLLSKKMPQSAIDAGFTAGGIKTEPFGKGPLDKALLSVVQNSKKMQPAQDAQKPGQKPAATTQGAGAGAGKDAGGAQPAGAQPAGAGAEGKIPPGIQAQLDQLTPAEKQYLTARL